MAGNQHVQPKTVPHWLSTVEVCENIRRVWSICAFDQMRNVFGQWHLMKQRCLFFRRANILTNTKLILRRVTMSSSFWVNCNEKIRLINLFLENNRSKPKNYTKSALFISLLLINCTSLLAKCADWRNAPFKNGLRRTIDAFLSASLYVSTVEKNPWR